MAAKTSQKKKKTGKKGGLTPRNLKFIDLYIETGNATQSYIRSGYSEKGAEVSANRLLRNANIFEEVERRRSELREKADVQAMDVINEYKKIAFANAEDYFEWGDQVVELEGGEEKRIGRILLKEAHEVCRDKRAAIAAFKETAQGGFEIKFHDKLKALDALGRYFGVNNPVEIAKAQEIKKEPERHLNENILKVDLSSLSNDELRRLTEISRERGD